VDDSLIRSYLEDARAHLRADEIVFWSAGATATDIEIAWWSTAHGLAPDFSRGENRVSLVQWAVQERVAHSDGAESVRFVVAPAIGAFEAIGAVSAACINGFTVSRTELREILERYARHLAGLHELMVTRDQYARSGQQTTALLNAAQRFTTQRTLLPLSQSIAQAAFEMTGGTGMSLIRWVASAATGEAVYATPQARVVAGTEITADSQVGQSCRENMPLILEDARPLRRHAVIYTPAEPQRELGALAIIPLHGTTTEVVGAIVIEGSFPRDIRAEDGKNLRLLGVMAGASLETVWQIEEITRRATIDPLTGLYNRGYFEGLLRQMVLEAERFGGTSSLVMLDLDHFKRMNDTHGHPAGDAVLRGVAEQLARRVRAVDSCARYGGEELALLLPRTDLEGAAELAERLREAVAGHRVTWEGKQLEITISCGVAAFPRCARSATELLAAADRALYAAKSAGRNRVRAAPEIAR
jgi:diguanylate cyclase (GGDEF)-like protein